jgi:hypothetical protein
LETQLDEMLENMNISVEPDAGHADEVMHDDGKRRQAEKDHILTSSLEFYAKSNQK